VRSSAKKTNLILITVFALVVVAGVGGMVPIGLAIQQLTSQRDSARQQDEQLGQHLKDLQALEKQYADIEKEIARVSDTLPRDKAISELLNQLDNMMRKPVGPHPINLSSLTISGIPLDPNAKPVAASAKNLSQTQQSGDFYELPLTIAGEGDFYTVLTVIDRVNSMSRLMAVTSVNMGAGATGFSFNIGVTAFLKP